MNTETKLHDLYTEIITPRQILTKLLNEWGTYIIQRDIDRMVLIEKQKIDPTAMGTNYDGQVIPVAINIQEKQNALNAAIMIRTAIQTLLALSDEELLNRWTSPESIKALLAPVEAPKPVGSPETVAQAKVKPKE